MPFYKTAKLEIKKIYSADKAGAYDWRNIVASVSEAEKVAQTSGKLFQIQSNELPPEIFAYDTKNFIYLKARAISGMEKYGPNDNFDAFPWGEIEEAYPTFIGKGIYVEHDEDVVDKAVGLILDAEIAPDDGQYIICTFCIDRNQYPELCQKILDGTIKTVSMSCLAGTVECSLCGNKATEEKQLCDHMREFDGPRDANGNLIKTKIDPITGLETPLSLQEMQVNPNYCKGSLDAITGKKAFEINSNLVFVGLSAVAVPADKDAFIDQFNIKASKKTKPLDTLEATRNEMNRYITAKNKYKKELKATKTTKGEFGTPVVDYDIDEDEQTVDIYLDDGSWYSYYIQDRPMLTEFELAFKKKDDATSGRQNFRKVNDIYNEVIKQWPASQFNKPVSASRKAKRASAKALKASLEENIQETDKYLTTLLDIKDKVLKKIDYLASEAQKMEKLATTNASDLDEKEHLEGQVEAYKVQIKDLQKTLEQIKDKIIETKTQEFTIELDRELNLAQLYTSLNLSPDVLEVPVVEEPSPVSEDKEDKEEPIPLDDNSIENSKVKSLASLKKARKTDNYFNFLIAKEYDSVLKETNNKTEVKAAKVNLEDEANSDVYNDYLEAMNSQDKDVEDYLADYEVTKPEEKLNPIEKTLEEDYTIDFSYDYNIKVDGIEYSVKFDLDDNNKLKDGATVTELETGKLVSDPMLQDKIISEFKTRYGV